MYAAPPVLGDVFDSPCCFVMAEGSTGMSFASAQALQQPAAERSDR
jgi:hypothetical protein